MKFWDGEKYRMVSDSTEVEYLRSVGFTVVDDDAPEPSKEAPVAPKPLTKATPKGK